MFKRTLIFLNLVKMLILLCEHSLVVSIRSVTHLISQVNSSFFVNEILIFKAILNALSVISMQVYSAINL